MSQTNASWGNTMTMSPRSTVNECSSRSNALLNQVIVVSSATGGIHSSLRSPNPASSKPSDGNNEVLDHDLDTVKRLLALRHAQRWGNKHRQPQLGGVGKGGINKKAAMSTSALTNAMNYNQS